MTAPVTWKKRDLARAYETLAGAGMRIGRVEIDPNGRIVILSEDAKPAAGGANEWDEVLDEAPAPPVRKRVR